MNRRPYHEGGAPGRARACTRYSPAEVARIAVIYRPRRDLYKRCAARLALTA